MELNLLELLAINVNAGSNTSLYIDVDASDDCNSSTLLGGGEDDVVHSTTRDNSHHQIDRAYKLAMDVYLVSALCLVGFIGNALTIAVLHLDVDRLNTSTFLLQALAVADIFYLLTCVCIQPMKTIHEYTDWFPPDVRQTFIFIEPYVWPLASTAQTITTYTVILVTVDRYIAVCMPLQTQLRSVARAQLAVALVVIFSVLYNIPGFFEFKIVPVQSGGPSFCPHEITGDGSVSSGRGLSPHTTAVKIERRRSLTYFIVYKTMCFLVFRCVGPLVTLVVLNTRLIQGLRKMRRNKKGGKRVKGGRSHNRWSLTLMMVVVISVFIVCSMPDLGLRVAITLKELLPRANLDVRVMVYANTATNALLTFNTASNFLIYCLICAKFRTLLWRLLSCWSLKGGARRRGGRGGGTLEYHTELVSLKATQAVELASCKAGDVAKTSDLLVVMDIARCVLDEVSALD